MSGEKSTQSKLLQKDICTYLLMVTFLQQQNKLVDIATDQPKAKY